MQTLDDAKMAVENELEELGSFLYDLKGYIDQMIASDLQDIEMIVNDLDYDIHTVDSYIHRITNAVNDLESLWSIRQLCQLIMRKLPRRNADEEEEA